jgi:hypothetical protein
MKRLAEAIMQMETSNNPINAKRVQMTGRVFYTLSMLLSLVLAFSYPNKSFAVSSGCIRTIHEQAISAAIELSPTELKTILKKNEKTMLREVSVIQNIPSSKARSFKQYHDLITDIAKEKNTRRYEFMSRSLTDISMYIFAKYSPVEPYEYCNEKELLDQASVIYSGYDGNKDYSALTLNFNLKYPYQGKTNKDKLLQFYNRLVNETVNLWVSIWKEAGRNVDGLQKTDTLLRGKDNMIMGQQDDSIPKRTSEQTLGEMEVPDKSNVVKRQDEVPVFTNQTLEKYNSPPQFSKYGAGNVSGTFNEDPSSFNRMDGSWGPCHFPHNILPIDIDQRRKDGRKETQADILTRMYASFGGGNKKNDMSDYECRVVSNNDSMKTSAHQETTDPLLREAENICYNKTLSSSQGECVFTDAKLVSSRFDGYKTYWVRFNASGEWGMGRKCWGRLIQCRANKMANGDWYIQLQ